jgi:TRAP-type C4-dicarboxylate transport system permease small subunit
MSAECQKRFADGFTERTKDMADKKNRVWIVCKNYDIAIASIALAVLILLTLYGVIMRYIVGKPLTWLEEVQLFCMVWIVFAASGAAFRTKSHVAIEMVVELFPAGVQKVIEHIIDIVVTFVLGYLFVQSIGFVKLFIRSQRATSMLKIPYGFIYGIAPVAIVVMLFNFFYAKYFMQKRHGEN